MRPGGSGRCPPPAWHNSVTSRLPKSPPGSLQPGDLWTAEHSGHQCLGLPLASHPAPLSVSEISSPPQARSERLPAWVTPLLPHFQGSECHARAVKAPGAPTVCPLEGRRLPSPACPPLVAARGTGPRSGSKTPAEAPLLHSLHQLQGP